MSLRTRRAPHIELNIERPAWERPQSLDESGQLTKNPTRSLGLTTCLGLSRNRANEPTMLLLDEPCCVNTEHGPSNDGRMGGIPS